MSSITPDSRAGRKAIGVGVVLAPVLAGGLAAATNLANFEFSSTIYFALWGTAHLAVFGFGLWAASLLGRRPGTGTCVALGLLAGAVEGFAVFQLLNHLTVVNDGFVMELVTGPEDYIAVVATAVMFTAGAMRGLRVRVTAVNGPDGPATRSAAPSAELTTFFAAVGPSIVAVSTLLKAVLA